MEQIKRCLVPGGGESKEPPDPQQEPRKAGSAFCIHGLPGIGKSHTAIEFAYRHEKSFSHVFWISADDKEKLEQGYMAIARDLGLGSANAAEEPDKLLKLALAWMKDPKQGRYFTARVFHSHLCFSTH